MPTISAHPYLDQTGDGTPATMFLLIHAALRWDAARFEAAAGQPLDGLPDPAVEAVLPHLPPVDLSEVDEWRASYAREAAERWR